MKSYQSISRSIQEPQETRVMEQNNSFWFNPDWKAWCSSSKLNNSTSNKRKQAEKCS